MKNYVDIPVPVASAGCTSQFEPLEWAKKNCPSFITNDAVQHHGDYYYRFFFGKERDQLVFALRWS